MQFYKKIMVGKRTTYQPVESEPEPVSCIVMTDAQMLTAAGALGATLLCLYERVLPPHKRIARKVKAVEDAILNLYHGSGEAIDPEISDHVCKSWDRAMKDLSTERDCCKLAPQNALYCPTCGTPIPD